MGMKIALAADHAGFALKEATEVLFGIRRTQMFVDFGAMAEDPTDDYPDFIRPACDARCAG